MISIAEQLSRFCSISSAKKELKPKISLRNPKKWILLINQIPLNYSENPIFNIFHKNQ